MLFHLIKKDFLIVKKYVLIVFLIAAIIPPVMLWRVPEYKGILGFILAAVYAVFMLLQYVSLKEYQFPKAAALLCATPFSRKMIVLSKYIFCIIIYMACCAIYGVETLIIPKLGTPSIKLMIFIFFVISVFIGVYLPVQYKFGYEKTKFVFMIIIMASPVIFSLLLKMEKLNLDFISSVSPFLTYGGIALFSMMMLVMSVWVSVKFYNKADLA